MLNKLDAYVDLKQPLLRQFVILPQLALQFLFSVDPKILPQLALQFLFSVDPKILSLLALLSLLTLRFLLSVMYLTLEICHFLT
jgi:hypothetical protein